jgi:predicted Zn-dependent protease
MFKEIKVMATGEMARSVAEEVTKGINMVLSPEGNPLLQLLITHDGSIVEGKIDLTKRRYRVDELIRCIDGEGNISPLLLFTSLDIYYSDLDFVFGFTDMFREVSVVSLARLIEEGVPVEKVVERTVKTAIHEIGHLKGLRHCNNRRCVMTLSFNVRDTDNKDKIFCNRCYSRLSRSGGLNETRHPCKY